MSIQKLLNIDIDSNKINQFLETNKHLTFQEILESEEMKEVDSYLSTFKNFVGDSNPFEKSIRTPIGGKYILSEAQGINRIISRIQKLSSQTVTAFRNSFSYKVNVIRNGKIVEFIKKFGKQSDFGYYKIMGRWAECTDRNIPYLSCPEDMKVSTYEESFTFVKNNKDMNIWDFLYILFGTGKLGDQDSILIGLTKEDQDFILNNDYQNNLINKSIFESYRNESIPIEDEDKYYGMFSQLSDEEYNDLMSTFISPNTLQKFIKDNYSNEDTPLFFLYFPRGRIDTIDEQLMVLGRNISFGQFEQAFSTLRNRQKSEDLNDPDYEIPDSRDKWWKSKSAKGIVDGKKYTQVPFQVTEQCSNFKILGFEIPSSGTSLGNLSYTKRGILIK